MKNNFTLLYLLLIAVAQFSFAQQMPIDFSDSADYFWAFAGRF